MIKYFVLFMIAMLSSCFEPGQFAPFSQSTGGFVPFISKEDSKVKIRSFGRYCARYHETTTCEKEA